MSGETAEKILDVTHKLLVDRGFSAFSYADVAEVIQIRKASIHHHFPTKADLVAAVLERHRHRMEQAQAALDQRVSSALDRLKKYVDHWESCIRSMKEPFCIAALLGAELPSLPAEVQAEVEKHFTCLQRWISRTLKEGVKQGTLTLASSSDTEAEVLMAAVHGAMIAARVHHSVSLFKKITTNALQRITSK